MINEHKLTAFLNTAKSIAKYSRVDIYRGNSNLSCKFIKISPFTVFDTTY